MAACFWSKKVFEVIADEAAFELIRSSLLHQSQDLLVFKLKHYDPAAARGRFLYTSLFVHLCCLFQSQTNYMVHDKPITSSTGSTGLQYCILRRHYR